MDTFRKCYSQYIEHFKRTFPYVPAPGLNEWALNMRINNEATDFYTSAIVLILVQ